MSCQGWGLTNSEALLNLHSLNSELNLNPVVNIWPNITYIFSTQEVSEYCPPVFTLLTREVTSMRGLCGVRCVRCKCNTFGLFTSQVPCAWAAFFPAVLLSSISGSNCRLRNSEGNVSVLSAFYPGTILRETNNIRVLSIFCYLLT